MTAEGLSPASDRLSPNTIRLLKGVAALALPPDSNTTSATTVVDIFIVSPPWHSDRFLREHQMLSAGSRTIFKARLLLANIIDPFPSPPLLYLNPG
jgi:hypothetical protein